MTSVRGADSVNAVWTWLDEVMDPEIPVISIVDLGIVRNVQNHDMAGWVVTVTPTYSACPATDVIAELIREAFRSHGVTTVQVQVQLAPAWTTDWMSAKGREALRIYGVAPPVQRIDTSTLKSRAAEIVLCPQCDSPKTRLLSQFGSTACKALYRCSVCLEPFDYFKPH